MANAEENKTTINDIISTSNSDPDGVSQNKEDSMYEEARQQNPNLNEQEYSEAMGYVKQIKRIHRTKNKKAYELAHLMTEMRKDEIYKDIGYDSWNEYVSDQEVCPIPRSTAYKYVQVGSFMKKHDIGSRDFDEEFYDEHEEVDRIIEHNEDGSIDQQATRKANEIVSRVNYSHMRKIASAYQDNDINAAESRELMAKAIIEKSDDFESLLAQATGDEDQSSSDDDLFYEGLKGTNLIIPMGDLEDKDDIDDNIDKVKSTLRDLLAAAEDGELKEEVENFQTDDDSNDVEKLASKSTTYHKTSGGRYFGEA